MYDFKFISPILLFFLINSVLRSQDTEHIYLSGKDFEHPKTWEFMCSSGRNSNQWTTINVPSNWELEGFGEYTYGRWYKELNLKEPSKEKGVYRYTFFLPENKRGKHINLVFEGVMTDAEVFVNGESAGTVHQGGFYRFKYNVSWLLKYGEDNLLEVTVHKHSANHSVNRAERYADWWLFGGIYRPVWLEVLPKDHITSIRADAKHNGKLTLALAFSKKIKDPIATVSIRNLADTIWLGNKSFTLVRNSQKDTITMHWDPVLPWTPESPSLYELKVLLKNGKSKVHEVKEHIGFRTLAFYPKDGIYVNGSKIVMKGVNRHSFWPESGRSLSKRISLMDINLIKGMNMNAVRTHYPPAEHFLDACDSLGLFVLDELAGWQNPYNEELGTQLARSVLDRDANHPSVIIWDNGNEGGWSKGADHVFKTEDLQKRIVIHPWSDFDGWDTHHYPTYQTGVHRFNNGENVFFPTEFMHGTYDNGSGSGLEDFWEKYTKSPLFAGAFLWAYLDEAVLRKDWKGDRKYDSAGSLAPDGIVGPHREKEGSYFTIKDIFSPIQIKPVQITQNFIGELLVTNTYLFTNLEKCTFKFNLFKLDDYAFYNKKEAEKIYVQEMEFPNISPGETKIVKLAPTFGFHEADWLQLEAFDPGGKPINTWTWNIHQNKYYAQKFLMTRPHNKKAIIEKDEDRVVLRANNVAITLNTKTGLLEKIHNASFLIPLTNGPQPLGIKAAVDSVKAYTRGSDAVTEVFYSGAMDKITWTLKADGRLNLQMTALQKAKVIAGFDGPIFDDEINVFGFTFDFPEEHVKGFRWFGKGPYRVWKNRLRGPQFGLWYKKYNNTITGESFENLIYPEFKGYHANFYAGFLDAGNGSFKMFSGNENTFLRLFTPQEPKYAIKGKSHPQPEFPKGDISFLYEIPAMRSFKPIAHHGPGSQPTNIRIKKGDQGITMDLWFDFRTDKKISE